MNAKPTRILTIDGEKFALGPRISDSDALLVLSILATGMKQLRSNYVPDAVTEYVVEMLYTQGETVPVGLSIVHEPVVTEEEFSALRAAGQKARAAALAQTAPIP